jgi:hypothetical protein
MIFPFVLLAVMFFWLMSLNFKALALEFFARRASAFRRFRVGQGECTEHFADA